MLSGGRQGQLYKVDDISSTTAALPSHGMARLVGKALNAQAWENLVFKQESWR